jgi:hypothetical protein
MDESMDDQTRWISDGFLALGRVFPLAMYIALLDLTLSGQ